MKKSNKNIIKLGLFVLLGLTLIISVLYYLSVQKHLLGDYLIVHAEFKNVNGLQEGNNVRYAGINIGTVETIAIQNDTTVRVYLRIDQETTRYIRTDSKAIISSDGLLGSKIVKITPGTPNAEVVKDGDKIKTGTSVQIEDIAGRAIKIADRTISLADNLNRLIMDVSAGKGSVGKILNDTLIYADLLAVSQNMRSTSYMLANLAGKAKAMSDTILTGNGNLARLIYDDQLMLSLDSAVSNTVKITDNLEQLSKEIQEGQGVIPMLFTDTIFAGKVDTAVTSVSSGAQSFSDQIERLKDNFFVRLFFETDEKESKEENEE